MDDRITLENIKQAMELLKAYQVPGPYYIRVRDDVTAEMWYGYMEYLRRREKYLERYRRRGERMKKKK